MNLTPLLDTDQVGAMLQVSRVRVNEMVRKGILPAIRLGPRTVRFSTEALSQWLQGRRNEEVSK